MKKNLTSEEIFNHQEQSRRLQAEMFDLQSDQSRLTRKYDDLIAEIRRLKIEFSHLKEDIEKKSALESSYGREIELGKESITRIKKQLNAL